MKAEAIGGETDGDFANNSNRCQKLSKKDDVVKERQAYTTYKVLRRWVIVVSFNDFVM